MTILRRVVQSKSRDFQARFLAQLRQEDREEFLTIHAHHFRRLYDDPGVIGVAAQMLFGDDPHPLRCLGVFLAKSALTGIYRILLRLPTIPFVIRSGPYIWNTYHDTGKAVIEDITPQSCQLVVRKYPDMAEWLQEYMCGHLAGIFELTRAQNIQVEVAPRSPDDDGSTYRWNITWS